VVSEASLNWILRAQSYFSPDERHTGRLSRDHVIFTCGSLGHWEGGEAVPIWKCWFRLLLVWLSSRKDHLDLLDRWWRWIFGSDICLVQFAGWRSFFNSIRGYWPFVCSILGLSKWCSVYPRWNKAKYPCLMLISTGYGTWQISWSVNGMILVLSREAWRVDQYNDLLLQVLFEDRRCLYWQRHAQRKLPE